MPFERNINTAVGTIGIWNLNESSNELLRLCTLSNTDQLKYDDFIAERRKKEFLATRILLKRLSPDANEITYDKAGKPLLNNSTQNISISHSSDFACVFISEKNIGIDIEQTTRNIDKVASRFLHFKEQEFIEDLNNN